MAKYQFATTQERSLLMSKIKSKDTKPEVKLRRALYALGLRYRVGYKKLPGSPDILISKYKLVIFVDGEFWHGKNWEEKKKKIKSNTDYWVNKIEKNIKRDSKVNEQLSNLGYTVLRFWSLEIETKLGLCIREILDYLHQFKYPWGF